MQETGILMTAARGGQQPSFLSITLHD